MFDPIHLAALVGSRICHDLISPIGAISNGVELVLMDGSAATGQEMALILESAAAANARIRFFRVAFGQCAPNQRIARSDVMAVFDETGAGGRITYIWDSADDLPRREVKLAFLALLCLESAMIYGGEVRVGQTDAGWTLVAAAPRLRYEATLWDALCAPESAQFDDLGADQVHFAVFALEAARQHRSIALSGGAADGRITIRF